MPRTGRFHSNPLDSWVFDDDDDDADDLQEFDRSHGG